MCKCFTVWHARGQGFKSPQLHNVNPPVTGGFFIERRFRLGARVPIPVLRRDGRPWPYAATREVGGTSAGYLPLCGVATSSTSGWETKLASEVRAWIRIPLAIIGGALTFFVVYLIAWSAWFWLTGANFKIGPSDLPVDEWVFYIVNLGFASAATSLVAHRTVTGRLTGYPRTFAAVLAVSGLWFLVATLATGDPESEPVVFYGAMATGVVTAVVASRWMRGRIWTKPPF